MEEVVAAVEGKVILPFGAGRLVCGGLVHCKASGNYTQLEVVTQLNYTMTCFS